MKCGLNAQLSHKNTEETAFFTMTKVKFCICNGKKCKRSNFFTMRKVYFMNYHGKTARRASRGELASPFFVALLDVFQEPESVYVHIFVIPEGSRS